MNLILFFNGWGMDSEIFENLWNLKKVEGNRFLIPDEEFEIIFINYPYLLPEIKRENYEKIYVLGWSFGVYYANLSLLTNPQLQAYPAIAINGTPEILGSYGILEKMMRFTMETLSPQSLLKFHENMFSLEAKELVAEFSLSKIDSSKIESLREELQSLLENYELRESLFNYALIGERDRIILTKNQERYFEKSKTNYLKIPGGHFLFSNNFTIIDIIRIFKL